MICGISGDILSSYKRNVDIDIGRYDDVIKRNHFPRCWPFVRVIHRSPVNSPHKGQWRGALIFSLICAWIKDWINSREAGDWRRLRHHYDVIIIVLPVCMGSLKRQSLWGGCIDSWLDLSCTASMCSLRWTSSHWKKKRDIRLTHWGRDKMDAISQTTFSSTFSWMKMFEFRLKFHWSLFLWVELTTLVQIMAWRRPLSETMIVSLPTRIYVIRPQWVKSSAPGRI